MSWFNNLKINTRILSGFVLLAMITALVGVIGISNLNKVSKNDAVLYQNMTLPLKEMIQIAVSYQKIRVDTRDMILANDTQLIKKYVDDIQFYKGKLAESSRLFEKSLLSQSERDAYDKYLQTQENYFILVDELIALSEANQDVAAFDLMIKDSSKATANAQQQAIDNLVVLKTNDAAKRAAENNRTGQSAVQTMLIFIALAVLLAVSLGIIIARSIAGPVNKLVATAEKLALGDVDVVIEVKSKDEIGILMASMAKMVDNIKEQAHAVERIAAGDLTVKLQARSDKDLIANSLNQCIKAVNALIVDANYLAQAAIEGKLDARADASKHDGDFRTIIQGVNATLDAVIGPLNVAAEYIERIANGNTPPIITDNYNGDFNEIKNNLNLCIDSISLLVEEVGIIISAGVEGKLDQRADAQRANGVYHKILAGMNDTLDAVIGPLNVAAEYVERISKGDIPEKITDSYKGDFNEIKNNLNACIDGLGGLVESSAVLKKMAVNDYTSKVEGQYQGIFADTAGSVNEVRTRLLSIQNAVSNISRGNLSNLKDFSAVGKRSAEDHLLPAFIAMMENIQAMVEDANVLVQAAVAGQLDTRVDTSKHEGIYAEIIDGINATLDAVIDPVQEAVGVIKELLVGNISARVQGDYKGDHAIIKDALNETMEALESMIGEISQILTQMTSGNLTVSLDRDYRGDFVSISTALKSIINSLNEVLGDIDYASEQVAGNSLQVSDSSQALAQGASEQASAIEELTSAVTEIAAQTRQNAGNANQANELALNARDNALKGNEQMKEMLSAMEGINESSANISKIIKVIDEIAFQTNILALNAAVEAARAGQHGKGFAVVAEEVRNLAARSASAAKETTDLIEGSIHKVNIGTKIANETAQALDKIVDGVSQAATLVGDIAVASNEQATGIAQVDLGIGQVSQVIQTNSATAEQSAAASEELSGQANMLKDRVARFQLKGHFNSARTTDYHELAPHAMETGPKSIHTGLMKTAAGSRNRAVISLDDGDYGKY